jgi:hypothetical protein
MFRKLWVVLAVVLGAVAFVGILRALDRAGAGASPRVLAEETRQEVRELRAELDLCIERLDGLEAGFRARQRVTEELRSRVDYLEGLHPDGVPADSYPTYLQVVEEYNASLSGWEEDSVRLRTKSSRCRELVEDHNARADTLFQLLVEAGMWEEGWERPGGNAPGDR